eukprot:384992-Amphidinium_carterae.1
MLTSKTYRNWYFTYGSDALSSNGLVRVGQQLLWMFCNRPAAHPMDDDTAYKSLCCNWGNGPLYSDVALQLK